MGGRRATKTVRGKPSDADFKSESAASSPANRHSSTSKQERKEMSLNDIAHCGEPMKLVRVIPKTEILAELKVFQCARCGHVKTHQ